MNPFKVKKGDGSRYKNNKLTLIFGGTVATIFLLILIKSLISKEKGPERTPREVVKEDNTSSESTSSTSTGSRKQVQFTSKNPKIQAQLMKFKTLGDKSGRVNYLIQQDLLKREFQKKIHLKIELPGHLNYTSLDLEDDIEGIVGTTTSGDQSFTVVATNKKVSMDQVVSFLNEATTSTLPSLKGFEFQTDKSFQETPPKETGLGPLTIVPTNESNGQKIFAAFTERSDGKGAYLFMMKAHTGYHEANDGALDLMLQGLRAEP